MGFGINAGVQHLALRAILLMPHPVAGLQRRAIDGRRPAVVRKGLDPRHQ